MIPLTARGEWRMFLILTLLYHAWCLRAAEQNELERTLPYPTGCAYIMSTNEWVKDNSDKPDWIVDHHHWRMYVDTQIRYQRARVRKLLATLWVKQHIPDSGDLFVTIVFEIPSKMPFSAALEHYLAVLSEFQRNLGKTIIAFVFTKPEKKRFVSLEINQKDVSLLHNVAEPKTGNSVIKWLNIIGSYFAEVKEEMRLLHVDLVLLEEKQKTSVPFCEAIGQLFMTLQDVAQLKGLSVRLVPTFVPFILSMEELVNTKTNDDILKRAVPDPMHLGVLEEGKVHLIGMSVTQAAFAWKIFMSFKSEDFSDIPSVLELIDLHRDKPGMEIQPSLMNLFPYRACLALSLITMCTASCDECCNDASSPDSCSQKFTRLVDMIM